jgi:hypothetical protein
MVRQMHWSKSKVGSLTAWMKTSGVALMSLLAAEGLVGIVEELEGSGGFAVEVDGFRVLGSSGIGTMC